MSRLKRKWFTAVASVIAFAALFGSVGMWNAGSAYADSTKITLTTSMVTNESGFGDAAMLVDEQSLAGDPKNQMGGTPTTNWFPGWGSSKYPANAYIDLGQEYDLTDIYLYDSNSIGDFVVASGSPGQWSELFTDHLENYQKWKHHTVNITTRYIRATTIKGAYMNEIVLYGSVSDGDTTAPAAIQDLTLGYVSDDSINLSWTTTGDDGNSGTASSYDIRYSTQEITAANWANATQVSGTPAPYTAGYDQAFNVTGLSADTAYYFAIEALDDGGNASALSNVPNAQTNSGQPGAKIILDPTMVTNEGMGGDAGMLVDEQAAAGDPKNGVKGSPSTTWFPGWQAIWYPANAVIDLGADYNLSDIYLYDTNGNGNVQFSTGSPGNWTVQITDTLGCYQCWHARPLSNVTTRYIRVNKDKGTMPEIVVYGTAQGDVAPPSPPAPQLYTPTRTVDQFAGANAFIDDPLDKMEALGTIREYHNWSWDEASDQLNWFNPSKAGGGWDFDTYYSNLDNAGIDVFTAIQGGQSWLSGTGSKAIPTGADPTDPQSYAAKASHMYQVAARYGSNTVADSNLLLESSQARVSGLNTMHYFEDANEPDGTWKGSGYYAPFAYAAMASADYDGDQGRLGSTYGVKNADSNAQMVMGGLGGDDKIVYISKLKYYADMYRSGSVPFDVLNVHHYCTTGSVGTSPEACGLKDTMSELLRYRNQYMPGKEVWVTEFGYDTNPSSPQSAPAIGSHDNEEVQGEWLVRSYLELAAAGVDRATMYMLRDTDSAGTGKYATSGLLTDQASGETAKVSWYYVGTMRHALDGMTYAGEQASGDGNVMIYKFKSASGSGAYVLWCPTANGTTVSGYSLALQGSPTSATQIAMQDGDTDGVSSSLTISGGQVTVDVSERPIFVTVNQMP